jgi:hypothetical protein
MKPLSRIKANGEARYPTAAERVRLARRKKIARYRENRAHRLEELEAAYGKDLDVGDERVSALVHDAAIAALQLELMRRASGRGEAVNRLELVRLSGARKRCLEKLAGMRAKASPLPAVEVEAAKGLEALRRHLASIS